jgi:hypothetical protein
MGARCRAPRRNSSGESAIELMDAFLGLLLMVDENNDLRAHGMVDVEMNLLLLTDLTRARPLRDDRRFTNDPVPVGLLNERLLRYVGAKSCDG